MLSILITGASGFVGQNLVPYLKAHNFKTQLLSLKNDIWKDGIEDDINAIIHLAGKAHDLSNTSNSDEYFKINTDLTIDLFNHFLNSNINDFIYFSSVKSVADTVSGTLTEDVTPDPKTPYGQSKQKAEKYLLSQKLPVGKRLFIIRPCMIHGPGNKGNLNLLYKFVAKGIPYPLAAFENKRSFLSIENLCFTMEELLKNKKVNSGIYNLADDKALSTNEVVKIIADSLDRKPLLMKVPRTLLRFAAKIGDNLRLPLNTERLKKLTGDFIVSNEKIKKALGIKFFPVSSEDGLTKTIRSFQSK